RESRGEMPVEVKKCAGAEQVVEIMEAPADVTSEAPVAGSDESPVVAIDKAASEAEDTSVIEIKE
ncbi:MAG: hypothetical protein IJ227_01240, partial [Mogibacterium sp.]|nr:hypothetical protein [Mogibacterium sp.]